MPNHPSFLLNRSALSLLGAFQAAGEEARFVGGCVRDVMAGVAVGDLDLATTALPERAMEIVAAAGFAAKPIGLAHGVILAHGAGQSFEIATLREDVKTDGRHALVAFTRDWKLDAQRRDFTINAMSMDTAGRLYDYCGGEEDLRLRRVRFIGDADRRITEDYLRILRYYRFSARFGDFVDEDARAACRRHKGSLGQLSPERVTDEIKKILSLPTPQAVCHVIAQDHVLNDWGLVDASGLMRLLLREKELGVPQRWTIRLAAWLGFAYEFNDNKLMPFVFSRAERAEIAQAATIDIGHILPSLHHYGVEVVRAAVLLRHDDPTGVIKIIENYAPKDFPLQAEDLLAIGMVPGPMLGQALRAAEDWWLKNNREPDAAACRDYAATSSAASNM